MAATDSTGGEEILACGALRRNASSGSENALREFFTSDAADAVTEALSLGNGSMARFIVDAWPMSVDFLVTGNGTACNALHSVARRVGRGSVQDQDLLHAGRTLLTAALRHYGPCGVPQWLRMSCQDYLGRSVLHYAVCASDPSFARLLIRLGAGVNDLDDEGASPLCMAVAERGSRSCLETLLLAGADVKVRDARGRVPLHIAAEAKNGMAAALLIHYGSNPLCPDSFGVAPIHLDAQLVLRASSFIINPELHPAARQNESGMACCGTDLVHAQLSTNPIGSDDHRERNFAGSFSSVTRWRRSGNAAAAASSSTPDLSRLRLDNSESEDSSEAEDEDDDESARDEHVDLACRGMSGSVHGTDTPWNDFIALPRRTRTQRKMLATSAPDG
jgi:hypothetical protein